MTAPHAHAQSQLFQGRRYLLTGASRGLGALALEALVARGAQVIAVARDRARLEAFASLYGEQVIPAPFDLSDPINVGRWADSLWENYGELHGVIHNAGVDDFLSMTEMSADAITRQVNLNLLAPLLINRALVSKLINHDVDAVIVHMSSVAGLIPVPFGSVYSATKAGLSIYAEALSAELYDSSIRFVTLHPGFVHGVGMHEAHKALAGRAPISLGGTSDQAVIRALLRSLSPRRSRMMSQVVNWIPIRPLAALYLLAPRLARALARRIVSPYLSRVAQARLSQINRDERTTHDPDDHLNDHHDDTR